MGPILGLNAVEKRKCLAPARNRTRAIARRYTDYSLPYLRLCCDRKLFILNKFNINRTSVIVTMSHIEIWE
jgi:hypothetical protein